MSVTILAGPPCSGKTTYARTHAERLDVVLDWDAVFADVSGHALYVQPYRFHRDVAHEFQLRAARVHRGFIIRSAPARAERAALRARHRARSIVLAVWPYECVRRLQRSDRPSDVKARQELYIHEWWGLYQADPSPDETEVWPDPAELEDAEAPEISRATQAPGGEAA